MAEPVSGLIKTVRVIDKFTDTSGTWVAWLNLPLVAVVAWEVAARYAFNAPTIWSFDLTYMLYGTIFMIGAAYTLYKGGHIRTDIFYQAWSVRTRGWVDAVLYLVLFFPGVIFFFWADACSSQGLTFSTEPISSSMSSTSSLAPPCSGPVRVPMAELTTV